MPSNQNPVIDKNDLADALAQDLTQLRKLAPNIKSLADLKDIAWPTATGHLARQAVERLRGQWEEAEQRHETRVKEGFESLAAALDERRELLESIGERRRSRIQKASEGKSVVAGRVSDEKTGAGLPDVRVNVFDSDRRYDDRLGDTRTDELGYYRIEYTWADFADLFEKSPIVNVEVLDEEGAQIYSSPKGFVCEVGQVEVIDASVDGAKLPASLELSKAVAHALAGRIKEYEQRKQVLKDRNAARFAG